MCGWFCSKDGPTIVMYCSRFIIREYTYWLDLSGGINSAITSSVITFDREEGIHSTALQQSATTSCTVQTGQYGRACVVYRPCSYLLVYSNN